MACKGQDVPGGGSAIVLQTYRSTCSIDIRIFLGRGQNNTNTVFRLVNPVDDIGTSIFKDHVFIKQANYE